MKDTLKYLRIQNNLSQTKVADYLGISRQMYIKYESGETEPTVKCVRELCNLYKVSYDVLIDDKFKAEALKQNEKTSSETGTSTKTSSYSEKSSDSPASGNMEVHESTASYTAGNINADSLNFRKAWDALFKLKPDDLVRIARKALNLAEDKKQEQIAKESEITQEEKVRLFNKFNGYIKDVKIEDWKVERLKYLDERYGV